ncbi:hypothetical protein [Jatrophihabitans sp.]|uniref:hypothetical protein n=1 Tax=Jatrophihabitans sp. TaxID=1932789 RepID=UPI0030C718CF|nr:hypothetical protein [Jatrophihabitans sp.]
MGAEDGNHPVVVAAAWATVLSFFALLYCFGAQHRLAGVISAAIFFCSAGVLHVVGRRHPTRPPPDDDTQLPG